MKRSKILLTSLALACAATGAVNAAVISIPNAENLVVGFPAINNPLGVSISGDPAVYLVGTMNFDVMELGGSFVEANLTNGGGAASGPGFGNAFGQTQITIANNGTAGVTSSNFVQGVPSLLVMRFNQTNGDVSLWVNPDLGDLEANNTADATNTLGSVNGSTFSTVLFRAGDFTPPVSTVDYTGFAVYYDGDTPFAIPEPSSLALLGLGGLLIARRRRA